MTGCLRFRLRFSGQDGTSYRNIHERILGINDIIQESYHSQAFSTHNPAAADINQKAMRKSPTPKYPADLETKFFTRKSSPLNMSTPSGIVKSTVSVETARNRLNNACQLMHNGRTPVYESTHAGPQHNRTWTSIIYSQAWLILSSHSTAADSKESNTEEVQEEVRTPLVKRRLSRRSLRWKVNTTAHSKCLGALWLRLRETRLIRFSPLRM
ncbi:hypothetical protein B0H34DRAFT_677907 [Crassisporium funariophilum]|nr:hypothetical protein B0H34DRAFT_677907 [Crassisporium funariophilum]